MPFQPRFIWLEKVDSTNTYCMNLAAKGEPEGVAVAAYFQEHGKGQRGNAWESQEGENLTFSLILRPTFLKVEEQFIISKAVALSVCDWINTNGVQAKVKWPNDIYIGDKKICGILIENSFSGPTLEISVVGIGLNLNQKVFSDDLPNPISMSFLKGYTFSPELVLTEIVSNIQKRYAAIKTNKKSIDEDYLSQLYRFDEVHHFSANNEEFNAKIVGVKNTGELIIEDELGIRRNFAFKEVNFII